MEIDSVQCRVKVQTFRPVDVYECVDHPALDLLHLVPTKNFAGGGILVRMSVFGILRRGITGGC